jgi:hypothetical protein
MTKETSTELRLRKSCRLIGVNGTYRSFVFLCP